MRLTPSFIAFATGLTLTGCINSENAGLDELEGTQKQAQHRTIRRDRGGLVINYALKTARLRNDHTPVVFAGRCDSACTLYLTLPKEQTCITPGASFGFHLPKAANAQATRTAQNYMMRRYPDWVKGWIDDRGGLSEEIITMDQAYARKHLRPCAV